MTKRVRKNTIQFFSQFYHLVLSLKDNEIRGDSRSHESHGSKLQAICKWSVG